MPPHQTEVQDHFESLLKSTFDDGKPTGLLLAGDFGTGKSHWLERLEHLAREQNFICSRIVLNKETPLHDLKKLYRAAVEAAHAPHKKGPALIEIAHTYNADNMPEYYNFREWAENKEGLDPRFVTTLHIFERSMDDEIRQKVLAEWTGYPLKVGDLKSILKGMGEAIYSPKKTPKTYLGVPLDTEQKNSFHVGRIQNDNLHLRFEFMARFFQSAGYTGWVILLDEAEMISRYSLRQRGKAYAHLAQLLGRDKTTRIPGVISAFTITNDYSGQVLHGRKNDIVSIPAKVSGTKDDALVEPAELGMAAIESSTLPLRPPTADELNTIYDTTRQLYSEAYNWSAPDLTNRREYAGSTGLRQYLREWINSWDLRRLYDYETDTIVETIDISYDEDTDIQKEDTGRDDQPETIL